ncbi:NAD-dependent epimerase/dehydratase family protein [Pseudomonas sp. RL_15y_Pfl2_60]|uniref:NAD-dependent epimerase/dehydratase family protein n=1 Tax=Pseudomonas sp. RL_15y_Pfl2_60 TaxID=3088709 RepID=UPI0030D6F6C7
MNILVTGATGFIGQALCRLLLDQGHVVHGVSRSMTTSVPGLISHVGQLNDSAFLKSILVNVDCVIHLAGRAHMMSDKSPNSMADFRTVNVDLTTALAKSCLESNIQRFIFISSIGVNGVFTDGVPFNETSIPAPVAEYAISKYQAECALKSIFFESSIALVIIRPPLVYDVNAPGNFSRLLKLVSTGLPIPTGRLENKRSIVSLSNLVDFIALSAVHPAAENQLFLISDGQSVSTSSIVSALKRGMKSSTFQFWLPLKLIELCSLLVGRHSMYVQLYRSLEIDAGKAHQLLGWSGEGATVQSLEQIGATYKSKRLC